jgi:thiamine biosynthesis protein ThiI
MPKAIALISGGIDSPVAAWLAIRAGLEVTLLHFDNRPFASEENIRCVLDVIKRLREVAGELRAYIVPHGEDVAEFMRACSPHNTCIHSRRHMHRVASLLANRIGASSLITGDLIASKASQTSHNLILLDSASSVPILRPLIGMEKEEIERIARAIGTYELASLHPQCTATPEKPATRASIARILSDEGKLDLLGMAERALARMAEV